MALGIPDKTKKPNQTQLGVPYHPDAPKADLMGQQPAPPPLPPFSGSVPAVGGMVPFQTPKAPQLPPLAAGQGPIFPDSPSPTGGPAPVSFGTNGQVYNPTTSPFGFDQSAPGTREQFWANNQNLWMQDPQLDWVESQMGQFQDPWAGEQANTKLMGTIANPGAGQQYWTGVQGQFNSMSPAEQSMARGYQGGNNSKTAFDMTKGMLPGSMQPQFDAYYDRMHDKAMSDVNSQSAARGAYGSNAALNNSIGAGLDVEAQRAKAATDFSLADSANRREWQGLLGEQGRASDLTGLQAFDATRQGAQFGLDKLKLGGDLAFKSEEMGLDKDKALSDVAFGVDEHKRDRLGAGIETGLATSTARHRNLNDAYEAAGANQNAFENRTNNLYGAVSGMGKDVQDFFMESSDSLLDGDQKAFESEIDAKLARFADARGYSDTQTAQMKKDIMDAADTYFSATGKGAKK